MKRDNTLPMGAPSKSERELDAEIERRTKQAPETVAAFEALAREAPTGEGPIVRKAAKLAVDAAAPTSGRQEHVENARLKTNPVGEAPVVRVALVPPVDRGQQVTFPSIAKMQANGVEPAVEAVGRTVGGNTQVLAKGAAQAAIEQSRDAPQPVVEAGPKRRNWLWAALAFALFGAISGLVMWLVQAVRVDERRAAGEISATVSVASPILSPVLGSSPGVTAEASASSASVPAVTVSARSAEPTTPRSGTAKASAKSASPTAETAAPQPTAPPATATTTVSAKPTSDLLFPPKARE